MPAASEPASTPHRLPDLPHTWRPLGPRIVASVLVVGLAVLCTVTWVTMDAEIRAKFTVFEKLTMAAIALGILVCVHALTRSRVTATRDALVVVNGYRRRELEWAEVVAVRMPPGAPWARLDLADGSEISAMGIQGSDGASAKRAVRQLRALAEGLSG